MDHSLGYLEALGRVRRRRLAEAEKAAPLADAEKDMGPLADKEAVSFQDRQIH